MRVLIEKVGRSTYDPEIDKIFNFWIKGKLSNGKDVEILDQEPFDLREFEKQEKECLIFAGVNKNPMDKNTKEDPAHPIFKGSYLGEYDIPNKWKLGRVHERYMLFFSKYHAIQIPEGIILISPRNTSFHSLNIGDEFLFKATRLELLAWEPITGEREIDPLAYEKKFIENFWNLMDSTREKCNQNAKLQNNLIYEQLLTWDLNEIWLIEGILKRLIYPIEINEDLKEELSIQGTKWWNFCYGTITLGKSAFKDAVSKPMKFLEDIKAGVYSKRPEDLISELIYIFQELVEEKIGKSLEEISTDDYMNKYLREDIEDLEKRIVSLLDDEFKIVRG